MRRSRLKPAKTFLFIIGCATGLLCEPKCTGISDPDELKAYLQKIGLLYAFSVVFVIVAGGETGRALASSLIENSLRKVVVPNAQTIKMLFQTM